MNTADAAMQASHRADIQGIRDEGRNAHGHSEQIKNTETVKKTSTAVNVTKPAAQVWENDYSSKLEDEGFVR